MTPVYAENALLQFLKDGDYYDFACITDFSIETITETKETRALGNGQWKRKRGQSLNYVLNCSGIIFPPDPRPTAFWLIENFQHQMLHVSWRAIFEEPTNSSLTVLTGEALISSSVVAAASTGFATSDFRMEGHGLYSIEDSLSGCSASIGYIAITDITGGSVTFAYDFVDDAVRIDYSINGGGRESIFDPGVSGTFAISGLADGDYTIVFYPVCENGNDGFSNELSFEITGGGGEVCDPPGETFFSDISNTGFTYNWTAPGGGPPADGYEWQLLNSSMTIIDSGTTASTSHAFSGLTPGATYHPRVRSICETGVSLSSFLSDEITLSSEPGANAVSYSFFPNGFTGTFIVKKNGVEMVNTTVIVDNAFGAIDGDEIETTITTGDNAEIDVLDTTTSTPVDTQTGTGTVVCTFTTGSGHNYQIDGILS